LLEIQGGAGRPVYRNVSAGVAGFALWQVSDDRGIELAPELAGMHTRAFGLGPEIDVTIPKRRMRVELRTEWDFGVVARPQGLVLVVGVHYLAWMPAIKITRLTTMARTGRRMNRSVNDFMGQQIQASGGRGVCDAFGARSLFSFTDTPLRNLKTPALATLSPALMPVSTLM